VFFNRFKRKEKVEGELGYFGLGDWWLSTFTEEERNYIEKVFQPMGGEEKPLTQGEINIIGTEGERIALGTEKAVSLLSALAGWFKKPEDFSIAKRILNKAEEIGPSDILDMHFLYQAEIQIFYRQRDRDPEAFNEAVEACQKQIGLAPKSARAFKEAVIGEEHGKGESALPGHVGYRQLAIIREKQKDYIEAIRLSKQAKKQGWNGDWDKRIARCEKKMRGK